MSCRSEEAAKKLKVFRNHGQSDTYFHRFIGGNFRLDALQAAILTIKLRRLDEWSEARRRNAKHYNELLAAAGLVGKVSTPAEASYPVRHIYNQYCITVAGGRRDALKQFLAERGIGCAVYYPLPLNLQPCFAELGGKAGDMPVAEKTAGEIMALPIYGEATPEQREFVVESVAEFLK